MTPSPWFYAFVKKWESFKPTAYRGKADRKGLWTIGWGHTGGVQPGDTCTIEQGQAYLEQDTDDTVQQLNAILTSPHITQPQFDALCSLAYNVGVHNLAGHELISLLNAGNPTEAAKHFVLYDKADGVEVDGLLHRREEERDHFLLAA